MALRIIPLCDRVDVDRLLPLLREIGADRLAVVRPAYPGAMGAIAVDGERVPAGEGPLFVWVTAKQLDEGGEIITRAQWVEMSH